MKAEAAREAVADIATRQWGMLTAAQAVAAGVSRMALTRMTEGGQLERIAPGVYRHLASPPTDHEDLKAAWLGLDRRLARDRVVEPTSDAVVAGAAAAALHGIGDLSVDTYEFLSPRRRQPRREDLHFRVRELAPSDVQLIDGLPVVTVERLVADLVDARYDRSLILDVLREAYRSKDLDLEHVADLLDPLAARNDADDGEALLVSLIAGSVLNLVEVQAQMRELLQGVSTAVSAYFGPDGQMRRDVNETLRAALQEIGAAFRAAGRLER